MAKMSEVLRSVNQLGKRDRHNPVKGLLWVLNQTARADINQMLESTKTSNVGLVDRALVYSQRAVEIGYIFSEVFIKNEYSNWQPDTDRPKVIDLGGDPGIFSLLYWKYKAPDAQITAVEANPATAKVMEEGIRRRKLEGVQIINAAVSTDVENTATLHLHKPRKGWHTQDYVGNENKQEDLVNTLLKCQK